MRPTKTTTLAGLAALAVLAACGSSSSSKSGNSAPPYHDDGKLTLMTRNLYLGANLDAALGAQDAVSFVTATTQAWAQVQANDFDARADKLADEIVAAAPDVVALEEASLWRTQTPGDRAIGGIVPATTVAIDYLGTLLDKLSKKGHPYAEAKTVELFDVEVPVSTGGVSTMDLRLTDRLAILAVAGLATTNARGGAYGDANLLKLSLLGNPVSVKRGWAAVDVTIGGQPITVVATHLESFAAPPRDAQATELVSILAPNTGRIALLGDLNSTPGIGGEAILAGAGFTDTWTATHPGDPGFTCCFPPDLKQSGALDERIDYILTRGSLAPTATASDEKIVGADASDKTSSGLWPSDHAGLVGVLQPSP